MNRPIVTAILIGGAFVSAGAAVAGLGLQSAARECAAVAGLEPGPGTAKRDAAECGAAGTPGARPAAVR